MSPLKEAPHDDSDPIVAATFLAATLSSGASPQVINGCIKNNRTIKIVDDPASCSSRETPISWNQQGPQRESGVDGVNGHDAKVLHVFDATGAEVGVYAGSDMVDTVFAVPWQYRVYLTNSEKILNVYAIDSTQQLEDVWFYFESTDCTGAIYAQQAGRLIRPAASGGNLYIATGTEIAVIEPRSKPWRTPLPVISNCATHTSCTIAAAPATVIDPATDLGVSPPPEPLYVGLPNERRKRI